MWGKSVLEMAVHLRWVRVKYKWEKLTINSKGYSAELYALNKSTCEQDIRELGTLQTEPFLAVHRNGDKKGLCSQGES